MNKNDRDNIRGIISHLNHFKNFGFWSNLDNFKCLLNETIKHLNSTVNNLFENELAVGHIEEIISHVDKNRYESDSELLADDIRSLENYL